MLFQFIYEITIIEESFYGFADLSRTLKDQLEIARTQKEMAEEPKQAFEAKLEKVSEKNSVLRKELCSIKGQPSSLEAKL